MANASRELFVQKKPQHLTKMAEKPLLQRDSDGGVFEKHLTRHLTKHLTIGPPHSLPERVQVAHVGGDVSLRHNST